MKTVGLLTIQGSYEAHAKSLGRAGAATRPVLEPHDLDGLDGLILPGGESTTMSKGLDRLGLYEPLRSAIDAGLPVLGTCAGAILLSRESRNHPVETIGRLDAVAVRNAYGTQTDSFADPADDGADQRFAGMRCVFIRAPKLTELGDGVDVLVSVSSEPVLVKQGNVLAATFHPELTDSTAVHDALLNL